MTEGMSWEPNRLSHCRSPSSRFPVLRSLPSLRRPSHSNRFAREWRRRERSEGYDMNEEAVR